MYLRVVVFILLLLVSVAGQTTYTDEDIQRMKSRYEPKAPPAARVSRTFPGAIWKMPYREPSPVDWMLPFGDWEREYRDYFRRHYGDPRLSLKPTAMVMHYTVTGDAASVRRSFLGGANMSAGDQGVVWGHVSVHFIIDPKGKLYQLMPTDRRCTGAYGVNHVALSIEMVARHEDELLGRPEQVFASFCLVRSLMRRFDIPLERVYAHHEVSQGRSVVPEYTDYADSQYPDRYPPASARLDPGRTYMKWLRTYVRKVGPGP